MNFYFRMKKSAKLLAKLAINKLAKLTEKVTEGEKLGKIVAWEY